MKLSAVVPLVVVSLALASFGVGCKKGPQKITPIPGSRTATAPSGQDRLDDPYGRGQRVTGPDVTSTTPSGTEVIGGQTPVIPLAMDDELQRVIDTAGTDQMKVNTVYFDFDRSSVRSKELTKVQAVADYLKGNPAKDVLVAGHCDERGTEQYNLALGERRALSVRETLVKLGINASRVYTRTYGETQPADPGQGDAAWAKNRRAEFTVFLPKQ
jgi:peptidoglycan-associated lipoprotein